MYLGRPKKADDVRVIDESSRGCVIRTRGIRVDDAELYGLTTRQGYCLQIRSGIDYNAPVNKFSGVFFTFVLVFSLVPFSG